MNKLLEVREFDIITKNKDYKNDKRYKYLDDKAFNALVDFIHEFSSTEENSDVLNFMRIAYKRNVGDIVTIRNYVGLIQMKNGYQIQVLPKISLDYDEDNKKTKRIFIKMLRSMKDFPSKVFNNASLKIDHMNLYEIFVNMYLQEVRSLVKRGLKSDYVGQEDNLRFYKGKLLVSHHIRMNMGHKERFYIGYDEFNTNRPENKLVKSTLLRLLQLTTSAENSKEIRRLLIAFELVKPSSNYEKDFAQVKLGRNSKDYELLMQWSKVFLLNKAFTTFSGRTLSRALLFSMERVYESYVAQQIKKALAPLGWDVSLQGTGYYLFMDPKPQFALRPDIVCKREGRTIIMDTKWKHLVNSERANYGISQGDMYQMYAYSKKYDTSETWLLYPLNAEMRENEGIKFESGDGTTVNVHFVNLVDVEKSMEELKRKVSS